MSATLIGNSGIIRSWKRSAAAEWALFIAHGNAIRAASSRENGFWLITQILATHWSAFGRLGELAPEEARAPGSTVKAPRDCYSFGAVVLDVVAGRPPVLWEHALAVIQQAAERRAPKLRQIVPKAARDLETICARRL